MPLSDTLSNNLNVVTRVTGVDEFSNQLKKGVGRTKDDINNLTKAISESLGEQFDLVKDKVTDTFNSIDGKAEATGSFMQQTLSGNREFAMKMGDSYRNFFKGTAAEQDKQYKNMQKNLSNLRYSAIVFSESTGIAADDVVNFSAKMTELTGDENSMNKFLKSVVGVDWQTFSKGLNVAGTSMEEFGGEYQKIYMKLGKNTERTNAYFKDFLKYGGDAVSMSQKLKMTPDIIDGYSEIAQSLTGGNFDTKDMSNYTEAYIKNYNVLRATTKMSDEEAKAKAKTMAGFSAKVLSDNKNNLAFLDDELQKLTAGEGVFAQLLPGGNVADLQAIIKDKGFVGIVAKMQEQFTTDGVLDQKKWGEAIIPFQSFFNKAMGDVVDPELLTGFSDTLTYSFAGAEDVTKKINEANVKTMEKGYKLSKLYTDYTNKNFKSTLVTAEDYAGFMDKLGDNLLVNLTHSDADKYLRKHSDAVYQYTQEAVKIATDNDTYLLGDIVKKYSAVKRMGVMGLFVQSNGSMSEFRENMGGILDIMADTLVQSTSFITMLGAIGFRFHHLAILGSPVTKTFGVLNNMTLGLAGSLGKLTFFVGGVAAIFNKIGFENINNIIEGTADFNLADKLSYDISRVVLKKNIATTVEEFNQALIKQGGDVNKIILNNKVFADAFKKKDTTGMTDKEKLAYEQEYLLTQKNAMKLIKAKYSDVDEELLKTVEGRRALYEKYSKMNNKVASDVLQSKIQVFINNAIQYVEAGLEVAGRVFKVLYRKIVDLIVGKKDESGNYITEPLYIRIKDAIANVFRKISSGEFLKNSDSEAFRNKLIGFLGISLGYVLLSSNIRKTLFNSIVGLFTSTFSLATMPIASAFSGILGAMTGKYGLKGMALTLPIAFYGVGKSWEIIKGFFGDPTKRAEAVTKIESILNLAPGSLNILNTSLNNIAVFFNKTLLPTFNSMYNKLSDFVTTTLLPTVANAIRGTLDLVKESFNKYAESVSQTGYLFFRYDLVPMIDKLLSFGDGLLYNQVIPIIDTVGTFIGNYAIKIIDNLGNIGFWLLNDVIPGLFQRIVDVADVIFPKIGKIINSFWENLPDMIFKGVAGGFSLLGQLIATFFTSKAGWLTIILGGMFLVLKKAIIPFIKDTFAYLKGSFQQGMGANNQQQGMGANNQQQLVNPLGNSGNFLNNWAFQFELWGNSN